ncbi:Kinase, AGC AktR [Giardia muris]|uniref:Kinase, AGC AktR n=1 Tax=Giardia muris TaxID=5742 RepID=A0A4Z1SXE5_GIAMU|nr:Kinase, AGC AktR [Giardia muris]|eukprot:TNJ30376.1 Kinase, AGC AktR [Giardia muris]
MDLPDALDPDDPDDDRDFRGLEDFNSFTCLGSGASSTVYKVVHTKTHQPYALKAFNARPAGCVIVVDQLEREKRILGSLRHPFLVQLYGSFRTSLGACLVLEYIPGGTLYAYLQRMKEKHKTFGFLESDVKLIAAQLVLAIEYLHKQNIIIRDLKPENILLQKDGYIKITDFGLSKQDLIETLGAKTMAGTAEYFSPEQLQNSGHGKGVDLWALGTIIYELIAGLPPFYDTDTVRMQHRIVHDQPTFAPELFSEEAQNIISGLLRKNPLQRLGCRKGSGEMSELKRHRWFRQMNWACIATKGYHLKYLDELDIEEPSGRPCSLVCHRGGIYELVDRSSISMTSVDTLLASDAKDPHLTFQCSFGCDLSSTASPTLGNVRSYEGTGLATVDMEDDSLPSLDDY